jgi:hypothetical protein
MAASCCTCMAWGIVPPHASVVVLTPCVMAHVLVRAGGWSCEAENGRARRRLVVRGGFLSCEAETCRARWRLVLRGRDLSCEAETCRGDPSCEELVRDVANCPKTRRLAKVGLDQGPQSSSS